ncbi:UvrD-helicase domain-containing protein [Vibrio alginolyticus]|uniref:UvrD-helicase domain-containing protein n=1 Tax=Vibrio alginolyticus TaxID=663 RepID=UPI00354F1CBA
MFVPEIKDSDVTYSEKILIGGGKFDNERVEFIKDLRTLDLQSVPGSGKTTALLAKLTILEKYMPFINNKGIVVISHTNSAVNEWKNKIGSYCPKLFSYPNFIGTIQSFANTYFAKPYMQIVYNVTDFHVDDDEFSNTILSKYHAVKFSEDYNKIATLFWGRNIQKAEEISSSTGENKKKVCERLIEDEVKRLYYNFSDEKFYIKGNKKCLISDKSNLRYQGLKKICEETFKKGIISFNYAYVFSDKFIKLNPSVLKNIRKRFKFAFVDEMQDMDCLQYDLLETCFNHKDMIYQRIGDSNQSIYNELDEQPDWSDRELVLRISGSHRLTPQIAKLVSSFSVSKDIVFGLNNRSNLKPHLIHFKPDEREKVIPTYLDLYYEYKECESIPIINDEHVGVISWVSKNRDDDKLTLASFIDKSELNISGRKEITTLQYDLLSFKGLDSSEIPEICECLTNAIVRVLNNNHIEVNYKRCTKANLFRFLSVEQPKIYEDLNKCLYKWSMQLLSSGCEGLVESVKDFTVKMCMDIDAIKLENLDYFSVEEQLVIPAKETKSSHITNGCKPQLGTIHSAKGQTHTSTLYIESYYDGNYESTLLNRIFSGEISCYEMLLEIEKEVDNLLLEIDEIEKSGKVRGIKTRKEKIDKLKRRKLKIENYAKMIYVGLSRPKHFLCVAIEDERFKNLTINKDIWQVVTV